MFSLLAFFVASAAYRAFRARDAGGDDSTQRSRPGDGGPGGPWVSHCCLGSARWPTGSMTVPNTAAQRGILIGVSLGAIATSIKIIFGIERAYLGRGDGA